MLYLYMVFIWEKPLGSWTVNVTWNLLLIKDGHYMLHTWKTWCEIRRSGEANTVRNAQLCGTWQIFPHTCFHTPACKFWLTMSITACFVLREGCLCSCVVGWELLICGQEWSLILITTEERDIKNNKVSFRTMTKSQKWRWRHSTFSQRLWQGLSCAHDSMVTWKPMRSPTSVGKEWTTIYPHGDNCVNISSNWSRGEWKSRQCCS